MITIKLSIEKKIFFKIRYKEFANIIYSKKLLGIISNLFNWLYFCGFEVSNIQIRE